MISLAVAAAGWVGVSSPGDYAAFKFPPLPRHDARDGTFDTRRGHTAILERGTAVIPARKNGRRRREDCPAATARNEILRATQRLGRAIWKRWSGYHARSRIEAKMRCLKAFGERIASRDPDRQTAEIHIRVALMNRFNARGTAEIERLA